MINHYKTFLSGFSLLFVPLLWIWIELFWPEIPEDIQERFDKYNERRVKQ